MNPSNYIHINFIWSLWWIMVKFNNNKNNIILFECRTISNNFYSLCLLSRKSIFDSSIYFNLIFFISSKVLFQLHLQLINEMIFENQLETTFYSLHDNDIKNNTIKVSSGYWEYLNASNSTYYQYRVAYVSIIDDLIAWWTQILI